MEIWPRKTKVREKKGGVMAENVPTVERFGVFSGNPTQNPRSKKPLGAEGAHWSIRDLPF